MSTTTPLTPEVVAACVMRAAEIGPSLGDLIARYHRRDLPNDPDTSRALQDAGMAIIPGVRLEAAVETAMWAHAAKPEQFAGFVVDVSTDGRANVPVDVGGTRIPHQPTTIPHQPTTIPHQPTTNPPRSFTTTDGRSYRERSVRSLIGASLPTPEACQAAVNVLHEALRHGISDATLWELSHIAVWESLEAARTALRAIQSGAPIPSTRTQAAPAADPASEWSDEIDWTDGDGADFRPASGANTLPAARSYAGVAQLALI